MAIAMREPGTYRTSDGVLIHCRVDREGGLRIEIEGTRAPRRDIDVAAKLSDDPDWPDLAGRAAELIPLD